MKYVDTVNEGAILFKDGILIHIAEDGFIKTVIGNAKVKSTWENEGAAYSVGYATGMIGSMVLADKGLSKLSKAGTVAASVDEAAGTEELAGAGEKAAILSNEEAKEIAFDAIHGSDKADSVVLGKFDPLKDENGNFILDAKCERLPSDNSYNVIAQDMDIQYFQLENYIYQVIRTYFESMVRSIRLRLSI